VLGTLVVNGSPSSEVLFASPSVGDWAGIMLSNVEESTISGARFVKCGVNTAITVLGSSNVAITDCRFENINFSNPFMYTIPNAIALHITDSKDIIIENNRFIKNIMPDPVGWHGDALSVIRFVNSSDIIFDSNIIEDNVTPQNVIFIVDESYDQIGEIDIQHNKIKYNRNRAGALVIKNLSNTVAVNIIDNQISYNSGSHEYLGSYEQSAGLNIDGNHISVCDNTLSYNNSHQGGGLYVVLRGEISVERNMIFRNTAIIGGGLFIVSKQEYNDNYLPVLSQSTESVQKFVLNAVFENVGNPSALYVASTKMKFTENPRNLNILQEGFYFFMNSFINNTCLFLGGEGVSAIQVSSGELALINCLTADNEGYGLFLTGAMAPPLPIVPNKPVICINSIFWGNSGNTEIAAYATTNIDERSYFYNSIITGENNGIDLQRYTNDYIYNYDTMFVDRYSQDYRISNPDYSTWTVAYGSPYENFIGLYPYAPNVSPVYEKVLNPFTWYYVSFPKLDRDPETNDSIPFSDLTDQISFNWNIVYQNELQYSQYKPDLSSNENPPPFIWDLILDPVCSTNGYKIMVNAPDTLYFEGPTISPNQKIQLIGGQENWIGYFLNRKVSLFDAFSLSDLGNIEYIKTQYGGIYSNDSGFIASSKERFLEYGDMVMIKPSIDMTIQWETGKVAEPDPLQNSRLFVYTSLPNYTSIFVEVDPQDIPAEIAVFVNGVCKGASVYEGVITEVLAYLDEVDVNQEIDIVYGYYTRAPQKQVSDFALINPSTNQLEYKPLLARHGDKYYHIKHSQKVTISESIATPVVQLHQNYPNPFNPQTNISFYLSQDDSITLSIYNIRGQKVKDLYNGTMKSGMHSIVWNGRDKDNRQVSSGVYFYKLNTNHGSIQKKMLLLK